MICVNQLTAHRFYALVGGLGVFAQRA